MSKKQPNNTKGKSGFNTSVFTHYGTSSLVNMNLSDKQNVPYNALSVGYLDPDSGSNYQGFTVAMPSIAGVEVQTTVPSRDFDGWMTGIRLLYQQLRTANSGSVNYSPADIERYVLNVRSMKALNAFIQRLYKATYTFRSTNNRVPKFFMEAMNIDAESMMANSANLFTYAQRFAEQCKVAFPLDIDLFKTTEYMFDNIFIDSTRSKPSYYVTTFIRQLALGDVGASAGGNRSGGLFYFQNSIYNKANRYYEWEQGPILFNTNDYDNVDNMTYEIFINQCETIKNALLRDTAMNLIAADIIKAFGNKAFSSWSTCKIDDTVPLVFDGNFGIALQNAYVTDFHTDFSQTDIPASDDSYTNYYIISNNGQFVSTELVSDAISVIGRNNDENQTRISVNVAQKIADHFNEILATYNGDSITPGDVMNITRFIPSGCSYVVANEQENGFENFGLRFSVYGTEVITRVRALYNITSGPFSDNVTDVTYVRDIAGLVAQWQTNSNNDTILEFGQTMLCWSNFDYCPRIRSLSAQMISTDQGNDSVLSAVGPTILDFDMFASISELLLRQYYSYGNQSLLYAGASQNQSNSKVYGKSVSSKQSKYNAQSKDADTKLDPDKK